MANWNDSGVFTFSTEVVVTSSYPEATCLSPTATIRVPNFPELIAIFFTPSDDQSGMSKFLVLNAARILGLCV